jgi:hypothetical protein
MSFADAPLKMCKVCERDKPLVDEYWHRDIHSPDGYRHVCAQCRNEKSNHEKEQIVEEHFAALEARGIQHLTQLAEGGSDVPHMAEVYQCIMEGFGGPRLFAQHLIACYFHPKTTQHIKAKLLQTVIHLSRNVSDSGMISRDLETVPTEELNRMLDERMQKALSEQMGRLRVVGPAEPLGPALPPALPQTTEGSDAQRAVG